MQGPSPVMTKPICPRCGYEQSGTVQTWRESCPLTGTCSECGLGLVWADVMDPARADLPGFIEHARGGVWTLFKSAWRTWAWAMFPWVFWRKVRIEHRIVPWRWALWLLLIVGVLHAVTATMLSVRLTLARSAMVSEHNRSIAPGSAYLTFLNRMQRANPMFVPRVPLRVLSRGHAVVMLNCWLGVVSFGDSSRSPNGDEYWSQRPVLSPNISLTASELATFPRWSSFGSVPVSRRQQLHPRNPSVALLLGVLFHTAFAGTFILLPFTRRAAKIRLAHLARAWVFGLSALSVLTTLDMLQEVWNWIRSLSTPLVEWPLRFEMWNFAAQRFGRFPTVGGPWINTALASIVVLLLLVTWWYFALVRGWKIRHARFVFGLVAITAALAAFTIPLALSFMRL